MKRPIIATTIALGLVCVGGISVAQGQSQTANLQHVTVTATPAPFETYVVNLDTGYGLEVLVGNTHRQYMQAQRAAESSEALRRQGSALSPFVAVALDNSSGPGLARQIQLTDAAKDTFAAVNVYCKRAAMAGGKRCLLVSKDASGPDLASQSMERLHLAVVNLP